VLAQRFVKAQHTQASPTHSHLRAPEPHRPLRPLCPLCRTGCAPVAPRGPEGPGGVEGFEGLGEAWDEGGVEDQRLVQIEHDVRPGRGPGGPTRVLWGRGHLGDWGVREDLTL